MQTVKKSNADAVERFARGCVRFAFFSFFTWLLRNGSAGSVCNTRTKVRNPVLFTAHGD